MRQHTSQPTRRTAVLAAALGLIVATAHTVHAQASSHPAARPTPVRVGTAADYRPLTFKQDGQVVGIESDFARRLSADLGVPFEFVEVPWPDLIAALRAGRIDVIMSGMSITEERSELVSFADPYKQTGQMALVRRADYTRLRDPAAMRAEGVRVGVREKTTGEKFARAQLPKAKIVTYGSIDDAIAALRNRQLDFVIHDAPTIWRVVGRPAAEDPELVGLYRPLTDEYLAWAVRQDADDFRAQLNGALARWRENGELEQMVNRWVTVRKVTVAIPPQ